MPRDANDDNDGDEVGQVIKYQLLGPNCNCKLWVGGCLTGMHSLHTYRRVIKRFCMQFHKQNPLH